MTVNGLRFYNQKSLSAFIGVILVLTLPTNVEASTSSPACTKIKTSIKKLDDRNSVNWKKFDARRDAMANLNFINSEYKKTLSMLKSVYQSDLTIYNIAIRNLKCYSAPEVSSIRVGYDGTIDRLAGLNKIISSSSQNSESKFNSMKETIWLWIAGEYMDYYTLDGRKV
jgi:hypothetical protein